MNQASVFIGSMSLLTAFAVGVPEVAFGFALWGFTIIGIGFIFHVLEG